MIGQNIDIEWFDCNKFLVCGHILRFVFSFFFIAKHLRGSCHNPPPQNQINKITILINFTSRETFHLSTPTKKCIGRYLKIAFHDLSVKIKNRQSADTKYLVSQNQLYLFRLNNQHSFLLTSL